MHFEQRYRNFVRRAITQGNAVPHQRDGEETPLRLLQRDPYRLDGAKDVLAVLGGIVLMLVIRDSMAGPCEGAKCILSRVRRYQGLVQQTA